MSLQKKESKKKNKKTKGTQKKKEKKEKKPLIAPLFRTQNANLHETTTSTTTLKKKKSKERENKKFGNKEEVDKEIVEIETKVEETDVDGKPRKNFKSYDALSLKLFISDHVLRFSPLEFEKKKEQEEQEEREQSYTRKKMGFHTKVQGEYEEAPKLQFIMTVVKDSEERTASREKLELSNPLQSRHDREMANLKKELTKIRQAEKSISDSSSSFEFDEEDANEHGEQKSRNFSSYLTQKTLVLEEIEYKQVSNGYEKLRIGCKMQNNENGFMKNENLQKKENKTNEIDSLYLNVQREELTSWNYIRKLKCEKLQHTISTGNFVYSYRWTLCLDLGSDEVAPQKKTVLMGKRRKQNDTITFSSHNVGGYLSSSSSVLDNYDTDNYNEEENSSSSFLPTVLIDSNPKDDSELQSLFSRKMGTDIKTLQKSYINLLSRLEQQRMLYISEIQKFQKKVARKVERQGIREWTDNLLECLFEGFDLANNGKYDQQKVSNCYKRVNLKSKFLASVTKKAQNASGGTSSASKDTNQILADLLQEENLISPAGTSYVVSIYSDGSLTVKKAPAP